MEIDIVDAKDGNQGFISNLQERIIVQETHPAKLENVMKNKCISLPINPTIGKQYTCQNNNWQGASHDDTNFDGEYLRKYKTLIPIKPTKMVDGGCVDEGITVAPGV
jgi:hypothetical protein